MKELSKASNILTTVFGRAGDSFLCKAFNVEEFEEAKVEAEKYMGIIVYFSLDMLYEFLRPKTTERKILRILNRTLKIIHHEISCLKGKIYSNGMYSYYAIWRFEEEFGEKEVFSALSSEDKKNFFKTKMTAKAEVAFSALFIAIFKIKIFIREYMHYKHNKINMKSEHIVGFILHAGLGYQGAHGTSSKTDLVVFGRDLLVAKQLAPHSAAYKSDLLVTEFAYSLLTPDVVYFKPDQKDLPLRD